MKFTALKSDNNSQIKNYLYVGTIECIDNKELEDVADSTLISKKQILNTV